MLSSIYEAYLFYSKYDHFGKLFYEISRKDIDIRLRFLDTSIGFFPYHIYYLVVILKYFNSENKALKISIEKILKLKGSL